MKLQEDRVRWMDVMGMDKIPDQRVPDSDLLRILRVIEEGGGTYVNNVLPGENSCYDLHEVTTVELHNARRKGWCKREQGLRTYRINHGTQRGQIATEWQRGKGKRRSGRLKALPGLYV